MGWETTGLLVEWMTVLGKPHYFSTANTINLGEEKKTNIFLRCNEPSIKNALDLNNASEQEIFSKLRDLKDSF